MGEVEEGGFSRECGVNVFGHLDIVAAYLGRDVACLEFVEDCCAPGAGISGAGLLHVVSGEPLVLGIDYAVTAFLE